MGYFTYILILTFMTCCYSIEPRMSSTRLKSEEIYRERISSDSLFTARTHNPVTSISNTTNNPPQVESIEDISSIRQDDVFENEDLFGPPPLPKADSKLPKSKIPSLFDDSDSGDELFSTTSSGSRSQRSSDLLTTSHYSDKIKSTQRRGLFDEEINIFDNKDSPDVDIFGIIAKPVAKEESNASNKKFLDIPDDDLFTNSIRDAITKNNGLEKNQNVAKSKEISLFDNDVEDSDLFSTKSIKTEIINKSAIFNDDYENDLFSMKKSINKKKENDKESPEIAASGIDIVDQKVRKSENKSSDILSSNGLFSTTIGSHGLIFEDDDYDDLFNTKNVITEKTKQDEHETLEIKKNIKEDSAKDIKVSNNSDIFVKPEESNVSVIISKDIKKDTHSISNSEECEPVQNIENELKMSPPKSLDIHTTATSSSPDKNNQTKRMVSGKIKNLMGKMGDLKMISPMDTPPVWRKSKEKTDEEDNSGDRDSDDGGCVSTQSHNSPLSASGNIYVYTYIFNFFIFCI